MSVYCLDVEQMAMNSSGFHMGALKRMDVHLPANNRVILSKTCWRRIDKIKIISYTDQAAADTSRI